MDVIAKLLRRSCWIDDLKQVSVLLAEKRFFHSDVTVKDSDVTVNAVVN